MTTISKQRALVVDDEPGVRRCLVEALERERFECVTAGDGTEARKQLTTQGPFDVVITDLAMPQAHGHALAVELLQQIERPLVVVMTGLLDPRPAKDVMSRGVDDVLFKPLPFRVTAAKIRKLCERRAATSGKA